MNFLILGVLPYITILVFIVGMTYRLRIWVKTPQPGALTLFPAPDGKAATFVSVIRESLLFPSLFRGNRFLWLSAWVFHVTLALIFVGHIRVFTDFPALWSALGINADSMSAWSGGIAGVIIMVCAVFLIMRRLTILRVRQISNLSDFMTLLLVLGILATGNMMRFAEHFDLELTRAYFSQLITFSVVAATLPQSAMFSLHILLAQALIMLLPFSKIMHFGGIFFTQTVIQKA